MMWKLRSSFKLKSQIGLQLWKTWIIMWASIVLWKLSEGISKFQPKSLGYHKLKHHKHDFMKNTQKY